MKRNLWIAAIALLLVAGSSFTAARAAAPATMNVGTYNIWCGVHDDGPLPWKVRCQRIAALIRFHDYDIIGMQEVRPEQMADLRTALPEFTAVGTGREGINQGEHSPVFFRTDRFALLDSGTFWLSETPEKVSRGWDADYNRICSWVKLRDRQSKKEFFYFNTHLDHKGKAAREEGVKLLIEKIHEIAGKKAPAIVGGDFNTPVDSPIFKPLTKYMVSARAKAATTDHKGTFNGFGSAPDTIVIDHLYYRGKLKCQLFATLDGNYGAPYISDHYPIAMVFTL